MKDKVALGNAWLEGVCIVILIVIFFMGNIVDADLIADDVSEFQGPPQKTIDSKDDVVHNSGIATRK